MTVGVVSPGSMGAAVGAALVGKGVDVVVVLDGRSEATKSRAERCGLRAVGDVGELMRVSDVVLSIVPPGVAVEVACELAEAGRATRSTPVIVDANAVAPRTARRVADAIAGSGARFVDGGIIGGPPAPGGRTALFLSGRGGDELVQLLAADGLDVRWLGSDPTAASALKVCYAAWTKGSASMLLAIRALAKAEGVEDALVEEWGRGNGDPLRRSEGAAGVAGKAWRWVAEMEEIATALEDAGLPGGHHRAAAEVYRRMAAWKDVGAPPELGDVVDVLLSGGPGPGPGRTGPSGSP